MKIYCVGGAVRDELLGLPVKDRDCVVVGATPEEMVALGYKPVGNDFPVFLHPQTHEEYALARTERKTAHGYHGFAFHAAPDVTLEQDLARRDLTINAIAQGRRRQADRSVSAAPPISRRGVLRHVSPAFAEDPVRILRVARFAARFGFTIAPETLQLMRKMVAERRGGCAGGRARVAGTGARPDGRTALAHVRDAARVRRAGAHAAGSGCAVRRAATAAHHPEIDTGVHVMMVVDDAARASYALAVRFAALTHDLGKGTTPREEWPRHIGHEARSVELVGALCERLRVPGDCRDLALLVAKHHGNIHRAAELRPDTMRC